MNTIVIGTINHSDIGVINQLSYIGTQNSGSAESWMSFVGSRSGGPEALPFLGIFPIESSCVVQTK